MVSQVDLKALRHFIRGPVTLLMVHRLVVTTLQVIPCTSDKKVNGKTLPSLMTFINRLVRQTNVYTGTLMATLVYLDRLKLKLPRNAQGLPCTRHRIFLSCLVLASKFHNDSLPKNIHWAEYTNGLFSVKDINLMERQLLYLLNWDVKVSNDEMVHHLAPFLDPIRADLVNTAKVQHFLRSQALPPSPRKTSPRTSPRMSRSSSTSLALSLQLDTPSHSRQPSCDSVELLSPVQTKRGYMPLNTGLHNLNPTHDLKAGNDFVHQEFNPMSNFVNPMIELTARNEEFELNKMLDALRRREPTQI